MTNKTYDKAKWFSMIFLPALIALVGGVGMTLHWEHTDVTITIMTLFNTFLGALLGVSSAEYKAQTKHEEMRENYRVR